jgi:hypothetical protein
VEHETVSADAAVVAVPAVAMPAAWAGDETGRGKRLDATGLWHLPGRCESDGREAFECRSVVVIVVIDFSSERLQFERGFVDDIEVWDLWERVPCVEGGRRPGGLGGSDGLDRRMDGQCGG